MEVTIFGNPAQCQDRPAERGENRVQMPEKAISFGTKKGFPRLVPAWVPSHQSSMTTISAFRPLTATILGAVLVFALAPARLPAQASAAAQSLLGKAHTLEVRGRMDMAAQTWQQVLLADPNNTEALGGLARSAKLSGNLALSNTYVERLRAINPNDPGIARVENMGAQQNQSVALTQAGKYAEAGQYAQAMGIYRKIYGDTPPPGDIALAYYETESATEAGRPHAVAGLRALVERYPQDSRYQVSLGRILTYNPKTRAEGRRFLERHPADPAAQAALRQSLVWDAANPASASDIRAYLSKHNDAQLAEALRNQPKPSTRPEPVPDTPETIAERQRGIEIETYVLKQGAGGGVKRTAGDPA